ncbi:hypothetical protein OKW33_002335 [Paraburkholderia atlantica]|uniref:hypothetical protein n=1 Tax=Paraburkholderia atlantica TaxID=2654982 RepID=UPI003D19F6D5
MKHPTVYTTTPATGVSAVVRWDEQSSTLTCEVTYPPLAAPPDPQNNLSDLLDARFGIGAPPYVLTAGTLSMLVDQHHRLTGLDFYTNPERWTVRTSAFADPSEEIPHIDSEFDAHGHADDMGAPEVFTSLATAPFICRGVTCLTGTVLRQRSRSASMTTSVSRKSV